MDYELVANLRHKFKEKLYELLWEENIIDLWESGRIILDHTVGATWGKVCLKSNLHSSVFTNTSCGIA